jgi:hypothetical protein
VLPAALAAVLGGVGAVALAKSPRARHLTPVLAASLAVALVVRGVEAGDAGVDSVRRAQLEQDLGTALERAGPALRGCGTPLLPRGLGWAKGRVAYDLGIRPLHVRSAPTSAKGYVKALAESESESERLPPRPPAVRVALPTGRFVLLDPFGGASVRVQRSAPRLRELAAAGRWRILAPAADGRCTAS